MKQQNFILIISSPSGAGKTSIVNNILKTDKGFITSVSVTTRLKREGEVEGKDYYFISKEDFFRLKDEGKLLEDANVFGNYYGSPKEYVLDKIKQGYDVLFDVDWQGAHALKEKLGNLAVTVFILPPSLEELERRLRNRGQDSEEVINLRMNQAKAEISHYNEYDYVLVNKDLDKTLERIHFIIKAERIRHHDFEQFVEENLI